MNKIQITFLVLMMSKMTLAQNIESYLLKMQVTNS